MTQPIRRKRSKPESGEEKSPPAKQAGRQEKTPRTIWRHPERPPQIVVCAAIRRKSDGAVITSARHFDRRMHETIRLTAEPRSWVRAEQGFIDQFGNFLTRKQGWKIAKARQQIRRPGDTKGCLYSENLY